MTFKARESLSEQIAGHLAAQIIRGDMLAGDRIQELRVAGELEVSRGSVREALLISYASIVLTVVTSITGFVLSGVSTMARSRVCATGFVPMSCRASASTSSTSAEFGKCGLGRYHTSNSTRPT